MKLLNRAGLMLQPRQPFVDWVNQLPREISELDQPLSMAALEQEKRVYLVEEFEAEQWPELLESLALALLQNELEAWDTLEQHWPEPLGLELLLLWFQVEPLALAFDAAEAPLMTAQL